MKDFFSLIRLHKWRVDEKRRALGVLLGKVRSLEQQAAALEEQIQSEQQAAAAEPGGVGMYYGTFARAAVSQREVIYNEINELEEKIAVAQAEVREEYRDFKSFEIAQEARDNREYAERIRRDQIVLDEVAQEAHRRK
jgi:flagellar FliJ protein